MRTPEMYKRAAEQALAIANDAIAKLDEVRAALGSCHEIDDARIDLQLAQMKLAQHARKVRK